MLSFQSKTSQLLKKTLLNSEELRCLALILEFESSIPIAFAQDHMDQVIYTTIISMDFKLILKKTLCKCKDQMPVLWFLVASEEN